MAHSSKRDDMVRKIIEGHREHIKALAPKQLLKNNPNTREELLAIDNKRLNEFVTQLDAYYKLLLPYVKSLKEGIPDITEATYINGIYLLLCHICDAFETLFILAKAGKGNAIAIQSRMIKEADMLIQVFVVGYQKNDRTYLDKWFSGEIINHGTCNDVTSDHYKQFDGIATASKELAKFLYRMDSLAPHNAYSAILELVSPFTEDFDFDGYTQKHFSVDWAGRAYRDMIHINISLKNIYFFVVQNEEKLDELDNILIEHDPDINNRDFRNALTRFSPK